MRLHHLSMTAFGPFADQADVDFDALSAGGLFLLTGDNGAGKTTILDAVCFALFGQVPGDRELAKSLRSHHARAGSAPTVSLEVTLGERRFRIDRSPAWDRPKKRGAGLTRQQPSVVVAELVGDRWATLTTRLDEAGHLLGGLVGLTMTQFVQIALLPQGKFDAFLRSGPDERRTLLQKVFRTERFHRVEGWFRERRVLLSREVQARHDVVSTLMSRVAEASAAATPPGWEGIPGDLDELRSWLTSLQSSLGARASEARAAADRAVADREAADAALTAGREVATLRERHALASRERSELEAESVEVESVRERLAASERAARVAPVLTLVDRASFTAATARAAAAKAADAAGPCESHLSAAEALARRAGELRAALPHEQALAQQEARAAECETRLGALEDRRTVVTTALARAQATLSEHEAAAERAQSASEQLPGATIQLERSVDALRAAEAAEHLTIEIRNAVLALEEGRALRLDRHEYLLHLRELRLQGMAAELAGQLAVGGGCCPVCGSDDHPQLATVTGTGVDQDAERAAQKAFDDATTAEFALSQRLAELRSDLAAKQAVTGGADVATLTDERTAATSSHAALARCAATLSDARARAERSRERCDQHREQLRLLDLERVSLDERRTAALAQASDVRRELERLAGPESPSIAGQLVEAEGSARAHRAAHEAQAESERAERELVRASGDLADALAAESFADAVQARAALLAPAVATELRQRLRTHEERLAATARDLADPGLIAAAAAPAPDVETLAAGARQAQVWADEATTVADRTTRAHQRVDVLSAALRMAVDELEPARIAHAEVAELAAFVEGKSRDNAWQMRLSAYVLAYRLRQVVAAANLRLARMSDQRYALEHSGTRAAGEIRGGLSLRVRDDWSGETRDPATLSGGESFIVSLALALGLADVISQEAGGAQLDTLFVDEGFGSLDSETLDLVLDTLDGLRDGGRVVGVVSHVPEMKDRIPTQLHILKGRAGSSIR